MGAASGRAERRELWILLGLIFGIHLGWFLVLPYWAVVLTRWRRLSVAEAGTVLAAQSLAYLISSLAGGPLADRFGRRRTIVAGLLVQATGLTLLAVLPRLSGLLLAALVIGLGSGAVGAPAKAGIAALTSHGEHATAFSWRGVAANLGVTTGPLLGGLLVGHPALLFATSAALHGALAGTMALILPAGRGGGPLPAPMVPAGTARPQVARLPALAGARTRLRSVAQSLGPVLTDRRYVTFSLLSIALWFLYTQLNLAVPLRALAVLGGARSIGVLWTFSALLVISLQVPLTRTLAGKDFFGLLALGAALLGLGLGSFGLAADLPGLLAAVAVFTAGEMLVMPTTDAVVARLAPPGALGAYFGVAAFVYGLGDSAGNSLGGLLLGWTGGNAVPWVLYTLFGLSLSLAAWRLGRGFARRRLPAR